MADSSLINELTQLRLSLYIDEAFTSTKLSDPQVLVSGSSRSPFLTQLKHTNKIKIMHQTLHF